MSNSQAEAVMVKVQRLMNSELGEDGGLKWRGWYFKKLFGLGERQFLLCAEVASRGSQPKRLFTYWLSHADELKV